MLLYKKERQQYIEAVVGDVSPSATYGAEHLLRLFGMLPDTWFCHFSSICHLSSCLKPVDVFAIENKLSHIMTEKDISNLDMYVFFSVKLPDLLGKVTMEEETLIRLKQKLNDFLK